MHSFVVFIQKEWMEIVRTKKLFILLCVFSMFGIIAPLTARYMHEIIALAMGDTPLPFEIPPATWIDGWSQFYSNMTQMGIFCIIFLFMSCVTGEKQSGSASLTLTKNLSHTSFIMAKFVTASAVICLSFLLSVLICFGYTHLLFGYAGAVTDILLGAIAYAIFSLTLLAIVVLTSTMAKSTAISALLAFASFILLTILTHVPHIGSVMPGVLLSKPVELSAGAAYSGIIGAVIVSVCISALCLYGSVWSLKKQEV